MNQFGYQTKRLFQLAAPIFIAQVTQTLMGFTDTVMAGQVSATDMAAVAIGTSLWFPPFLFILGILMAYTPVVSGHHGANNPEKIRPFIHQAAYIAIIGALLVMIVLSFSSLILSKMALEPKLSHLAEGYIDAVLWGAPAFMLYQTLRSCSEGISYTLPTMVIGFIGLLINIPANYIFINGYLGAPAMGGAGCGVATALVMWCMLISMVIYIHIHPKFKTIKLFHQFYKPNLTVIKGLTILGLPIGLSVLFEVSLFSVIALLLAPLGSNVVASHQIALNFSSVVFMLPLSIGMAVSIRVGYYVGRENIEQSKSATKIGLGIGLAMASLTAIITLLFKERIALIYNSDPIVVQMAVALMGLAALYQISDAVQVVAAGALRGYKDNTITFFITLISYWGVGVTLGYILGKTNIITPAMGAKGFWIGLIAGLTTAAVLFFWRLHFTQKKFALQFKAHNKQPIRI